MARIKWRLASIVLCDKNVSPKLEGKFYIVVVRLTLLYGAECWLVKKSHVQKMQVVEMSMLRGVITDKVRNEDI